MNNRQKFWEQAISVFEKERISQGYSESYVKEQVKALRRLLREFKDLGEITDLDIWQRYMYYSKSYRTQMTNALKAFRKWLNGRVEHGED